MSTLSQTNFIQVTTSQGEDQTTNTSATKTTFTIEEIQQLIPHRYPFLLVDKIVDYIPGKLAVGIKNVLLTSLSSRDIFPDVP